MGNAVPCLAGGSVVKVMLPDSTIERYDHAVKVAELAARYPNYAVVHCSTAKPSLGQLRAVIVMKMDEFLVPGQAYILYPIPKSFNDSVHTSRDTETSSNHSSDPEIVGGKTKMGSGLLTAEDLEQSLSQTLMGPAMRKVTSEVVSVLSETGEKKQKKEKKEIAAIAVEPCTWTPDLYQICENSVDSNLGIVTCQSFCLNYD